MNPKRLRGFLLALGLLSVSLPNLQAVPPSTPYGRSYQVNVNAAGQNIPGDAANEPSLCIDPVNPSRMAVGWRQFDTTNSSFRQAGWAYSTNAGLTWTFPGVLQPGQFRSDPVLAADANGWFYYMGITNANSFYCELRRSTNGGVTWQPLSWALGGDKEWMTIDTTSGPGRGNIYQLWSPFYNYTNAPNKMFTRSVDGGKSWSEPVGLMDNPFFGTLDVGPNGEVYVIGVDNFNQATFRVLGSTNATNRNVTPAFDLSAQVDLGGPMVSFASINPDGLAGQAWIAADRSSGPTRGNVYALCSVTNNPGNLANVMFSRSTNGGLSWSEPRRINDDSPAQNAWHWFGTLSVAPNGRIDVCWNDTRHSINNSLSELYYSWSEDGGLTWASNRPLSPPFNHALGYPVQQKMGDYIGMVSRNEGACIAYTATFNGEEDVFFVRAELPITAALTSVRGGTWRISWKAVPGNSYCVQAKSDLSLPWLSGSNLGCVLASSSIASMDDASGPSGSQRFYRIVRQP